MHTNIYFSFITFNAEKKKLGTPKQHTWLSGIIVSQIMSGYNHKYIYSALVIF